MTNTAAIAALRSQLGMAAARDAAIYIVVCKIKGVEFIAERDMDRTGRANTIADIASGQIENVARVYALNIAEGWSSDVSEEIAEEVASRLAVPHEVSYQLRNFIEYHCPLGTVPVVAFEVAQ